MHENVSPLSSGTTDGHSTVTLTCFAESTDCAIAAWIWAMFGRYRVDEDDVVGDGMFDPHAAAPVATESPAKAAQRSRRRIGATS
jgi:hypothetical protein